MTPVTNDTSHSIDFSVGESIQLAFRRAKLPLGCRETLLYTWQRFHITIGTYFETTLACWLSETVGSINHLRLCFG
jgi:hypothetical protein